MAKNFNFRVSANPIAHLSAVVLVVFQLVFVSSGFLLPKQIQAEVVPTSDPKLQVDGSYSRKILHRLSDGVVRFRLSNGLRVLFYRRAQAPVFSGHVWVKVGSVNEQPGITGVSHMLEHMAFKGTKTIGTKDYNKEKELLQRIEQLLDLTNDGEVKLPEAEQKEFDKIRSELETIWENNEFARIYQQRGAVGLNAATGKDYTYYQVSLPSVSFELWCLVESDRLLNPVFRQFYKERAVVGEERRSGVEDNPQGKLYETLLATAFALHPNRIPTIGYEKDIQGLRLSDLDKLYSEYYRPDNMVVSLVGDLDAEQVKSQLERYFGRLPAPKGKIEQVRIVEPEQKGERKAIVEYDAEPQFMMGYHKPVFPNPDDLKFSALHSILSEGRSSLFHRELVLKKQLATGVYTTEAPGELFPNLFLVGGSPRKGVSVQKLKDEVQAIFDRIKREGVAEEDLVAAKKRMKVDLVNLIDSNDGLAETLGHAELVWGDWERIFEMYDGMLSATNEDIKRIANTYLRENNRTVVELVKTAKVAK